MAPTTTEYAVTDIASSGMPPGVDPEFMNRNIDRLATEVLPEIKARLATDEQVDCWDSADGTR